MIYVLYGTENVLINDFIENIKLREKIENIINYNLEDITIKEIIEDASYNSLFDDKKLIVVNNSYFLTKECPEIEVLEKYVSAPNEITFLVFVLNEEKINDRKKIVKLLKEKCVVKEFNELTRANLEYKIEDEFKSEKYKITRNAVHELMDRCNNDYSLVYSEIEKLKLYKLDDKMVELEDVKIVVSRNVESDVFKLTDALNTRDREKIFKVYNDLIENNNDPIMLIGMIASQFRLYKQVSDLNKLKYTEREIAKELGVNPYRVKLAREKLNYFSGDAINKVLLDLFDLDYKIKSGAIDKFVGLELFLLEF